MVLGRQAGSCGKGKICAYIAQKDNIDISTNKATFMVSDTIMVIIKNNIKLINTTSLSDSKCYLVKWQHISTISFSMLSTIQLRTSEQSKKIDLLQSI